MLILLAPSERKATPALGLRPVELATLSHPGLNPVRERILAALERLARGPRPQALRALGLSPGLSAELDRDAGLRDAPAAPAGTVYTGVLYEHLDLGSLGVDARARAAERMLIASALWGVVRLEDRIPAYRLSMGAKLPRLGGLATFWRPALTAALPRDGLVVDCRSGAYAAAWRPAAATVVSVRAFTAQGDVVSHRAKATRGDVARLLVQTSVAPTDPEGVAALVERAGHRVALTGPTGSPSAWSVDVHA